MIMSPGQTLLLPANPWFVWGTLLGALLLEMALQVALLGRATWAPDLLALTLV
ncbi:MAG: rod shape-determining protein MreD, partial [Burkholderiales bacterium 34-67-9]